MLPRLPVTTDTIVLPTACRLHLTACAEYIYSYGGATAYDPQSPRRRVVPHSRLTCRLPRVSLTYQSQVIPGYSRRFMCSRPQGTWDGLSSTTLPHLVVVPMRPSWEVSEPLRPSTPMRSPHLPFAGAKVHAFPHRTQDLMCRDPHLTRTALTRCRPKCGAGRS